MKQKQKKSHVFPFLDTHTLLNSDKKRPPNIKNPEWVISRSQHKQVLLLLPIENHLPTFEIFFALKKRQKTPKQNPRVAFEQDIPKAAPSPPDSTSLSPSTLLSSGICVEN